MALFRYKAVNAEGKASHGVLQCESELELEDLLRERGLWLIQSKLTKHLSGAVSRTKGDKKIGNRELEEWFSQWAAQMEAGIPLISALEHTLEEEVNPRTKPILKGLLSRINQGSSLSEAMGAYPKAFSSFIIHNIHAGETTGALPQILRDLQRHHDWLQKISSQVRQALFYPLLVLAAAFGLIILLLTLVIPRFQRVFNEIGLPLPGLTQFVFDAGHWAQEQGPMTATILLVCFIGLKAIFRFRPAWRYRWDVIKLKIYLWGAVHHKIELARLAHGFALMQRAGVGLLATLDRCSELIDNLKIQYGVRDLASAIRNGETLSEGMRAQKGIFSSMMIRMATIGEKTGKTDELFSKLANYYDEIVERQVRRMLAVFETLMIFFVVGTVGLIALSLYLPIIKLMTGLRQ